MKSISITKPAERAGEELRIADKLVLLDTFAVPSLLATPL
jgi:hypothetical protein